MFSRRDSPNKPAEKRAPWGLGIFARVFAYDLLLAGLAVAACALVTQYLIEYKLKQQVHSVAEWMVHEAFAVQGREAREGFARRLHESGLVRITLYDAEGKLLVHGGPAFALPGAEELFRLRHARQEGFTGEEARLSVAEFRGDDLLGYGFIGPTKTFTLGFDWLTALAVLGAIALIAWPLAVSLLRPVRALGEAMQRFGAGDLMARVERPGQDEIGELAVGFNSLADRVQDLLQAEKMLLAAVSHELRTPLQRVRLALELATDAREQVEVRRLTSVTADLNELDELISEILVVARLDQSRSASDRLLTTQPVPPDELISECVARFESAHPERSVRWLEGPPLPLCAMDPRFVRRALLNLLENAAQYSPREESIEIAAWVEVGDLILEVRDRGKGIPAELHGRIFEPFFQGEVARGTASGSGLGLSIVQRIAEAHGGKASVVSSKAGSTFRIRLPIER